MQSAVPLRFAQHRVCLQMLVLVLVAVVVVQCLVEGDAAAALQQQEEQWKKYEQTTRAGIPVLRHRYNGMWITHSFLSSTASATPPPPHMSMLDVGVHCEDPDSNFVYTGTSTIAVFLREVDFSMTLTELGAVDFGEDRWATGCFFANSKELYITLLTKDLEEEYCVINRLGGTLMRVGRMSDIRKTGGKNLYSSRDGDSGKQALPLRPFSLGDERVVYLPYSDGSISTVDIKTGSRKTYLGVTTSAKQVVSGKSNDGVFYVLSSSSLASAWDVSEHIVDHLIPDDFVERVAVDGVMIDSDSSSSPLTSKSATDSVMSQSLISSYYREYGRDVDDLCPQCVPTAFVPVNNGVVVTWLSEDKKTTYASFMMRFFTDFELHNTSAMTWNATIRSSLHAIKFQQIVQGTCTVTSITHNVETDDVYLGTVCPQTEGGQLRRINSQNVTVLGVVDFSFIGAVEPVVPYYLHIDSHLSGLYVLAPRGGMQGIYVIPVFGILSVTPNTVDGAGSDTELVLYGYGFTEEMYCLFTVMDGADSKPIISSAKMISRNALSCQKAFIGALTCTPVILTVATGSGNYMYPLPLEGGVTLREYRMPHVQSAIALSTGKAFFRHEEGASVKLTGYDFLDSSVALRQMCRLWSQATDPPEYYSVDAVYVSPTLLMCTFPPLKEPLPSPSLLTVVVAEMSLLEMGVPFEVIGVPNCLKVTVYASRFQDFPSTSRVSDPTVLVSSPVVHLPIIEVSITDEAGHSSWEHYYYPGAKYNVSVMARIRQTSGELDETGTRTIHLELKGNTTIPISQYTGVAVFNDLVVNCPALGDFIIDFEALTLFDSIGDAANSNFTDNHAIPNDAVYPIRPATVTFTVTVGAAYMLALLQAPSHSVTVTNPLLSRQPIVGVADVCGNVFTVFPRDTVQSVFIEVENCCAPAIIDTTTAFSAHNGTAGKDAVAVDSESGSRKEELSSRQVAHEMPYFESWRLTLNDAFFFPHNVSIVGRHRQSYLVRFVALGLPKPELKTARVMVAWCEPGRRAIIHAGVCAPCPAHATCNGTDVITAHNGWWSAINEDIVHSDSQSGMSILVEPRRRAHLPVVMLQCGFPYNPVDACEGNSQCKAGYTSVRCATCADGYVRIGRNCLRCGLILSIFVTILVVLAWLALILGLVYALAMSEADRLYMWCIKGIATNVQLIAMFSLVRAEWPTPVQRLLSGIQALASTVYVGPSGWPTGTRWQRDIEYVRGNPGGWKLTDVVTGVAVGITAVAVWITGIFVLSFLLRRRLARARDPSVLATALFLAYAVRKCRDFRIRQRGFRAAGAVHPHDASPQLRACSHKVNATPAACGSTLGTASATISGTVQGSDHSSVTSTQPPPGSSSSVSAHLDTTVESSSSWLTADEVRAPQPLELIDQFEVFLQAHGVRPEWQSFSSVTSPAQEEGEGEEGDLMSMQLLSAQLAELAPLTLQFIESYVFNVPSRAQARIEMQNMLSEAEQYSADGFSTSNMFEKNAIRFVKHPSMTGASFTSAPRNASLSLVSSSSSSPSWSCSLPPPEAFRSALIELQRHSRYAGIQSLRVSKLNLGLSSLSTAASLLLFGVLPVCLYWAQSCSDPGIHSTMFSNSKERDLMRQYMQTYTCLPASNLRVSCAVLSTVLGVALVGLFVYDVFLRARYGCDVSYATLPALHLGLPPSAFFTDYLGTLLKLAATLAVVCASDSALLQLTLLAWIMGLRLLSDVVYPPFGSTYARLCGRRVTGIVDSVYDGYQGWLPVRGVTVAGNGALFVWSSALLLLLYFSQRQLAFTESAEPPVMSGYSLDGYYFSYYDVARVPATGPWAVLFTCVALFAFVVAVGGYAAIGIADVLFRLNARQSLNREAERSRLAAPSDDFSSTSEAGVPNYGGHSGAVSRVYGTYENMCALIDRNETVCRRAAKAAARADRLAKMEHALGSESCSDESINDGKFRSFHTARGDSANGESNMSNTQNGEGSALYHLKDGPRRTIRFTGGEDDGSVDDISMEDGSGSDYFTTALAATASRAFVGKNHYRSLAAVLEANHNPNWVVPSSGKPKYPASAPMHSGAVQGTFDGVRAPRSQFPVDRCPSPVLSVRGLVEDEEQPNGEGPSTRKATQQQGCAEEKQQRAAVDAKNSVTPSETAKPLPVTVDPFVRTPSPLPMPQIPSLLDNETEKEAVARLVPEFCAGLERVSEFDPLHVKPLGREEVPRLNVRMKDRESSIEGKLLREFVERGGAEDAAAAAAELFAFDKADDVALAGAPVRRISDEIAMEAATQPPAVRESVLSVLGLDKDEEARELLGMLDRVLLSKQEEAVVDKAARGSPHDVVTPAHDRGEDEGTENDGENSTLPPPPLPTFARIHRNRKKQH